LAGWNDSGRGWQAAEKVAGVSVDIATGLPDSIFFRASFGQVLDKMWENGQAG
jgi:hypothetical protein